LNNGLDAECINVFDPSSVSDGLHTVFFNVSDRAHNSLQDNTTIIVDRNPPSISITNPSNGSYISSTILVNTTITDTATGISASTVRMKVSNATYTSSWYNMTCIGNVYSYQCTYSLNTKDFGDGSYTITVQAADALDHSASAIVDVAIDNTRSTFTLYSPASYMKGKFRLNMSIYDGNGLVSSSVIYSISTESGSMTCTQIGSATNLSCIKTFDSTTVADGSYSLTFYAVNSLGKNNSATFTRNVDNNAPNISRVVIQPITSKTPTTFSINATVTDDGSSVSFVQAKIIEPNGTFYDINMSNIIGNIWHLSYSTISEGKYTLNLTTIDLNNNNRTALSGLFYVGSINCGNGVCDTDENYCFCSLDCGTPVCADDEKISCASGIPKCIKKPIEATTTTTVAGETEGKEEGEIVVGGIIQNILKNPFWIILIIAAIVIGVAAFFLWPVKIK